MKTERELFEEWYLNEFGDGFTCADAQLDRRGEDYVDFHAQDTWSSWQAATQREGFKWVPVENIKSIYTSCNNALDVNNVDVYKGLAMAIIDDCEDMIGVCDD